MKKKVYCFDLDGTLCTIDTDADYTKAKPFIERIKKVNELSADGHYIIIFTARGTTTGIDCFDITAKQLEKWGVMFDKLIIGKPYADYFIDDKGIHPREFFGNKARNAFLAKGQT